MDLEFAKRTFEEYLSQYNCNDFRWCGLRNW